MTKYTVGTLRGSVRALLDCETHTKVADVTEPEGPITLGEMSAEQVLMRWGIDLRAMEWWVSYDEFETEGPFSSEDAAYEDLLATQESCGVTDGRVFWRERSVK